MEENISNNYNELHNEPQKENISQKTGRSAFWQVLGGGWQTVVRLGASIFLARALDPRDFGLYGMACIAMEFISYLGATGVNSGVIAKKDVSDVDICTCFWVMTGTRLLLFLIGFFGAPLAAIVFSEPLLIPILRVNSFIYLLSIPSMISETLLIRELKFGTINLIRAVSVVLESVLAVCLAIFWGLGYWSLVAALLAGTIFQGISIFIAERWTPKFRFSRESFRYLFKFGIHGLGFSITNYLSQNLDYLLVGRILGAEKLGLYEFSYRIPHLVMERISQPVGQVVFPALSKLQAEDQQMANGYLKTLRFVCLVTFPALVGLASIADIAVPVMWGAKWQSVVIPLQILCVCAALRCIPQPAGAIFYCKQRPDIPFKVTLLTLIWTAIAVGCLGYWFGVVGVAVGMLLSIFPAYISVALALKMTSTPVRKLIITIWPILLCSVICGIVVVCLKLFLLKLSTSYLIILVLGVLTGVIVYITSVIIMFPNIFREIISVIESITGKSLHSYLSNSACLLYLKILNRKS